MDDIITQLDALRSDYQSASGKADGDRINAHKAAFDAYNAAIEAIRAAFAKELADQEVEILRALLAAIEGAQESYRSAIRKADGDFVVAMEAAMHKRADDGKTALSDYAGKQLALWTPSAGL